MAAKAAPETVILSLHERLPNHLISPCQVTCVFQVESFSNYYALTMCVSGALMLTCQRCLEPFRQDYVHESTLALCKSDEVAIDLMSAYECIVIESDEFNLIDIVTDELNLFLPEKHETCHSWSLNAQKGLLK